MRRFGTVAMMWAWLNAYLANDRLQLHNITADFSHNTYRTIHHRSQAKLRRLARQRK